MSADQATRQAMNNFAVEQPLSRDESQGIIQLLFKDGRGHLHDSWKQGFFFDKTLKYGVFQD